MNRRSAFLMIGLIVGIFSLFFSLGKIWQPVTKSFSADTDQRDTTTDLSTVGGKGRLLSAFFGLDNKLPLGTSRRICPNANRADGMPIIFAQEVDVSTVQAGDFQVVKQSGKFGEIYCVTMIPAVDPGELRTALLIGKFGSAKSDPPLTVEIVGNLLSKDRSINFKTAKIAVSPLVAGPTLILAEVVPQTQWKKSSRRNGNGCPQGTLQAVRAVWAGGVNPIQPNTKQLPYQVQLARKDGSHNSVRPFALADLGDGDNNHLLCLNVVGTPRRISLVAGFLVDPNRDPNPTTAIAVATP